MSIIFWFLGIISVLGVGGTIAAFIFVPTVAMPVAQSIVSATLKCKPCLYALAVVALCGASFFYGQHRAASACRAGELAAELAARNADLEAAHQAAADEAKRINTIEDETNARKAKDADYIARLEAKPACALNDSDIGSGRVRDLTNRWRHKKPAAAAK